MKLTINKDFADKYNSSQKKLEFQKLQDKFKNGEYLSESSSSESEDDNAQALTDEIEKDWFCTLSAIIGKDPKIYDPNAKFYKDKTNDIKKTKKPKDKSMYLKDYERTIILEHDGKLPVSTNAPTDGFYNKEQKELKEGFKSFLESSDDDNDEIMKKRGITNIEKEKEEMEYIEWMKGQKNEISDNIAKELIPLKSKWSNTNIDDEDKFLKDYLLNKRYLEDDDDKLPTYDEIVLAEADEEQFEKEEIFAVKYNYRYEEPDQDFIKSYPRTITDTVRSIDDKRSQKRKEIKDRKEAERKKKKEELKKLKNLKKEEMLGKIQRLKEVIGHKNILLQQEDLEADFDPSKHDEVMHKLLGDDFYADEAADLKKPTFYDQDIDDEEIDWNHFTREEFKIENDNEEDRERPINESNKKQKLADDFLDRSRKKRKRRSKFLDAIEKSKPLFDPESKTFEEYFDKYYNLDYEDIIADQPCRFRYRNVVPNDFGLTTDEILKAREKELNAWVSVKKMSQYRSENEELEDLSNFKKKLKKKYKIITSLNESLSEKQNKECTNIPPKNTKLISTTEVSNPNTKSKKAKLCKLSGTNEQDVNNIINSKLINNGKDINLNIKNSKILKSSFDNKPINMGLNLERNNININDADNVLNINSSDIADKLQHSKSSNKNLNIIKEPSSDTLSRKQKKKIRKKNKKLNELSLDKLDELSHEHLTSNGPTKKKRKSKKYQLSDERLAAYKIDVNKFKYFYMPKLQNK